MALNLSLLQSGLSDLFNGRPTVSKSPDEGAARMAAAYRAYADGAQSCLAVPPLSLAAAEATLRVSLTTLFGQKASSPNPAASGMATAFTAFWIVPPVSFPHAFPGLVTVVGGTTALQAGLLSIWASLTSSRASADQSAAQHASVLDVFTKTVVVAHIGVGGCAGPIS